MQLVRQRPPLVPILLAIAMLAVVAAAALGPATGTVSAANSCPYGTCPSNGPGALTWAIGGLLAAIILLIAIAIIFQRRRAGRPPPPGGVSGWEGPADAGGPESPAAAERPPYMESPEDVGTLGASTAVPAGAAAADAAAAPGDIDSLMGELDRISGEILKRGGPGKKPLRSADDENGDSAPPES
jgi:hypothetical protein